MAKLLPFKFVPIFKNVLWGGDKIASFKCIASSQKDVGESWEISGVKGSESIVADGEYKGRSLTEIIAELKGDLIGEKNFSKYGTTFPLLIKFIDANQDLSLQVHPDDLLANKLYGSNGKTEMWYILESVPGSKIYSGFSQSITPHKYEQIVEDNTLMDSVKTFDSEAGDIFFIPAGRIHSIGAGNLLLEVQQTSDITYRIYDFNRKDANGNLRELHTEQAKEAIDYQSYGDKCAPIRVPDKENELAELIKCDYFDIKRLELDNSAKYIDLSVTDSFLIVICLKGTMQIVDDENNVMSLNQGETMLVPATTNGIECRGTGTLILINN